MNPLGPLVDRLALTVDVDGRGVVLGIAPGPAGVSTVPLAGGLATLAVDTAAPDNLVSLDYGDPADPEVDRVLSTLFGPEVRDAVLRGGETAGGDEPLVLWRTGAPSDQRGVTTARRRGSALPGLGRFALLAGELTRGDHHELAVGLGLLELADLSVRLRELRPGPGPASLVHAAAGWLPGPDRFRSATVDPKVLWFLEQQLDTWARTLVDVGGGAGAVLRQARELLGAARSYPGAAARSRAAGRGAPSAAPFGAERTDPFDLVAGASALTDLPAPAPLAAPRRGRPPEDVPVHLGPELPQDAPVLRARLEGSHLSVDVGAVDAAELWLRVFRSGTTPVPLALAPFDDHAHGRWQSATALVPAGVDRSELLVDVTTRPGAPWRSRSTRATERAIGLGIDAARSERRDDADAPDRWEACADEWSALGDADRAGRARELAGAPSRSRGARGSGITDPARPLVTDLLADLVADLDPSDR